MQQTDQKTVAPVVEKPHRGKIQRRYSARTELFYVVYMIEEWS